MTTATLLLQRAMGRATSEAHVRWAEERLLEGLDSRGLRILAGLNPRFEAEEIESYFLTACRELEIDLPAGPPAPRSAAFLVKNAYDLGEISAEKALRMMADLYQMSDYGDPLLSVWYTIDEEFSLLGSGHEGAFYPTDPLADLDHLFIREWRLFELAIRLAPPGDFLNLIRCDRCGHIGKAKFRQRGLVDRLRARFKWCRRKPPLWPTCRRCGSFAYRSMVDPEVREAYLTGLVGR